MRIKVLLIESNAQFRSTLESELVDAGYDVCTAENREEALEFLPSAGLAVIAPESGDDVGLAFVKYLRNQGNTMPILLISERDRWSQKVEGLDAGADDYIAKPFHPAELISRVRAAVRRKMYPN